MNARRSSARRPKAALRLPFSALLVSVGVTLAVFAGCGLSTSGLPPVGGGGSGGVIPCAKNADCGDDPCKIGTCGDDSTCAFENRPDGPAPADAQTAHDCKTVVCKNGKAQDQDEVTDFDDDGNDCTFDTCGTDKEVHHTPKPSGATCDDGNGHTGRCTSAGKCVVACTAATAATDCATTDPCLHGDCNTAAGECVYTAETDGTDTPGVQQTAGDCHKRVCIGGKDTNYVDPSDVLVTGNDCITYGCDQGTPTQTNVTLHDKCSTFQGGAGFCDGAGACVECTEATDCAGKMVSDDCNMPGCSLGHQCFQDHQPQGTATATTWPQTTGDCLHKECDGNGNAVDIYDANDPASDGNACTQDLCNQGTGGNPPATTHPNESDGSSCGGGSTSCVAGQCTGCVPSTTCATATCNGTTLLKQQTCTGGGICPAQAQQDCFPYKCTAGVNSCPTTCNVDADCANQAGYYCTGAGGTCQQKVTQGTACTADKMCQSNFCRDGFCCNSTCGNTCESCAAADTGAQNGTCAPVTAGTDPANECSSQAQSSCGRNGFCGGGNSCQLWAAGTACGSTCANGQLTPQTCNGTGSCVNGTAAPCANNLKCSSATACFSSCGTGAGADSTKCISSTYTCEGTSGLCKLAPGQTCSSDGTCSGGHCGVSGVGHCCSNTCTAGGTCGANDCSATGACQYAASGTDCGSTCNTTNDQITAKTCNGSGTCSTATATACPNHLKCASGTACQTACGASDATGDGKCVSGYFCDGAGAGACQAKHATGACPTGNHECTTTQCLGGFCCSSTCTTGTTCGANACTAAGACTYPGATVDCGTSCDTATDKITSRTCKGDGTCQVAGAVACPNRLQCADATACLSACGAATATGDANCVSGAYCDGVGAGACQQKHATGACPTGDHECNSGNCGLNKNCCTQSTCAAGDLGCANNGCDSGGACTYPTGTVCQPASCPAGSATLTAAKTCTAAGACTTGGQTSTCTGGLVCDSAAASCYANCLNGATRDDTRCVVGDYCDAAGACHALKNANTTCGNDYECSSGLCKTKCCPSGCNTSHPICGVSSCTTQCNYPGGTTSCDSCTGNTLTPGACDNNGGCTPGTAAACTGHLKCQNATSCWGSCGTNDLAGDAKCTTGYYCNGTACTTLEVLGNGCTRDEQCASTHCDIGVTDKCI